MKVVSSALRRLLNLPSLLLGSLPSPGLPEMFWTPPPADTGPKRRSKYMPNECPQVGADARRLRQLNRLAGR